MFVSSMDLSVLLIEVMMFPHGYQNLNCSHYSLHFSEIKSFFVCC